MEAEEDCTLSLHLNETYVKAYFRRATARENLGKLKDAIKGRTLSTSPHIFRLEAMTT